MSGPEVRKVVRRPKGLVDLVRKVVRPKGLVDFAPDVISR
jgi:hypothetical protein